MSIIDAVERVKTARAQNKPTHVLHKRLTTLHKQCKRLGLSCWSGLRNEALK